MCGPSERDEVIPTSDRVESRIAKIDWSDSELGLREHWPPALRCALDICLRAQFPIVIYWGPNFVQLYNDAAGAMFGARHPAALGRPAKQSWPELWDVLGRQLAGVKTTGVAAIAENWRMPPDVGEPPREAYFTSSYSPIEDNAQVGGVFCLLVETTAAVLHERETRSRACEP